jgi:hypothetical protein
MPERLRFYCRGTALVEDVHAANRTKPLRRFIGRRWQEALPGRFVWAPTGKPQEVDYHADLVKACKDGDLWPADAATAKACGVGFDPDFGGEHTESIKEFKAKAEADKKAAADDAAAAKAAPSKKSDEPAKGGKGDGT